ncbi:MAG TPA: ATP-binding protein, partial [Acidimicrobiales bacterium]|nr:ATP-binding protein [Acidimicrobiales bacterium]
CVRQPPGDVEVEVGAYYLVAEALTNVNKHAKARRATVRATVADGTLRVAVSDDGIGGAGGAPGSGLEGLADRVTALGGQLLIESEAGGGTTVSADIPLTVPPDVDVERRRLTALRWIGWENWEAPGELYEQITDEDNLLDVKAVLLCAGGTSLLTPREREWFIGYHTAAGTSDRVIEFIKMYDDSDTIEGLMQLPGVPATCRGFLYEALRACASDGPLTGEELDRLQRGADAMGIPHETFAELHQIVAAEQALRDRRYELITAPVLAGNLATGSAKAPSGACVKEATEIHVSWTVGPS